MSPFSPAKIASSARCILRGRCMTKAAVEVVPDLPTVPVTDNEGLFRFDAHTRELTVDGRCLDERHRGGRDLLLHTLIADARRALEHAEPTIVTVVSEAGYGKSATRQRTRARAGTAAQQPSGPGHGRPRLHRAAPCIKPCATCWSGCSISAMPCRTTRARRPSSNDSGRPSGRNPGRPWPSSWAGSTAEHPDVRSLSAAPGALRAALSRARSVKASAFALGRHRSRSCSTTRISPTPPPSTGSNTRRCRREHASASLRPGAPRARTGAARRGAAARVDRFASSSRRSTRRAPPCSRGGSWRRPKTSPNRRWRQALRSHPGGAPPLGGAHARPQARRHRAAHGARDELLPRHRRAGKNARSADRAVERFARGRSAGPQPRRPCAPGVGAGIEIHVRRRGACAAHLGAQSRRQRHRSRRRHRRAEARRSGPLGAPPHRPNRFSPCAFARHRVPIGPRGATRHHSPRGVRNVRERHRAAGARTPPAPRVPRRAGRLSRARRVHLPDPRRARPASPRLPRRRAAVRFRSRQFAECGRRRGASDERVTRPSRVARSCVFASAAGTTRSATSKRCASARTKGKNVETEVDILLDQAEVLDWMGEIGRSASDRRRGRGAGRQGRGRLARSEAHHGARPRRPPARVKRKSRSRSSRKRRRKPNAWARTATRRSSSPWHWSPRLRLASDARGSRTNVGPRHRRLRAARRLPPPGGGAQQPHLHLDGASRDRTRPSTISSACSKSRASWAFRSSRFRTHNNLAECLFFKGEFDPALEAHASRDRDRRAHRQPVSPGRP